MRRVFIAICVIFMCGACSVSYAHPPTEVTLEYNKTNSVLRVIVIHPVRDPSQHHIGNIEVASNGEMIIRNIPPEQDRERLIVEYPLEGVAAGDIIKVMAICNMGGERANEITIPK